MQLQNERGRVTGFMIGINCAMYVFMGVYVFVLVQELAFIIFPCQHGKEELWGTSARHSYVFS